jgi:hypothetical protein
MRWPARLRMLLRSLFQHQRIEADLDDEIRDHLEQEIRANIQSGMDPEEARYAAMRLVGSRGTRKNAVTQGGQF